MFKNITSGLFSPTLILCNRRKPILLFAKFLLRISQSWRFGKMDYNLINPTTIPVSRHKLLCIGIFLWKERWKVVSDVNGYRTHFPSSFILGSNHCLHSPLSWREMRKGSKNNKKIRYGQVQRITEQFATENVTHLSVAPIACWMVE